MQHRLRRVLPFASDLGKPFVLSVACMRGHDAVMPGPAVRQPSGRPCYQSKKKPPVSPRKQSPVA